MQDKTDILIIGGGVIGVCIAHYLSESGKTVRIIEKDEVGAACSSKNAGLVVPSHVIPLARPGILTQGVKWLLDSKSPFYIKPRIDFSLFTWLWKFMRASSKKQMLKSIPILHGLLQESHRQFENLAQKFDFDWTQKGLLMICKSEQAFAHEIADARLARETGLEVRILNEKEIRELEPNIKINATGGVYYLQDAHIDPILFVQRLVDNFNPHSVTITPHLQATGFELDDYKIRCVKTDTGNFYADEIVIAGGAFSPAISKQLGINIPVQAGKGCSVTVTEPTSLPKIPFILSEAQIAVTPMGNNLRFAGTMELSPPDLSFRQKRTHAMLEKIPGYLPEIDPEPLKRLDTWIGLRPCTPDGLPIISKSEKYKNLTVATGHAMLGMSLAPVTGLLVNDLIDGRQSRLGLKSLSSSRFK